MKTPSEFEHYLSFINCSVKPAPEVLPFKKHPASRLAITISRQSGSGGAEIAKLLASELEQVAPGDGCPWTVFDRNLVERVLEEHHLPQSLARFMPEDRISEISGIMDELFGLHPSSWDLVRQTSDTILHLAHWGNVILIGRGAVVVTAKLENVFHVRLIGSAHKRVERLMSAQHLNQEAALQHIVKEDQGRERYLKTYFDKSIDDPSLYDLVINTDRMTMGAAAKVVAQAALITLKPA